MRQRALVRVVESVRQPSPRRLPQRFGVGLVQFASGHPAQRLAIGQQAGVLPPEVKARPRLVRPCSYFALRLFSAAEFLEAVLLLPPAACAPLRRRQPDYPVYERLAHRVRVGAFGGERRVEGFGDFAAANGGSVVEPLAFGGKQTPLALRLDAPEPCADVPLQQPRHIQRALERFGALAEPGHFAPSQQVIPDVSPHTEVRRPERAHPFTAGDLRHSPFNAQGGQEVRGVFQERLGRTDEERGFRGRPLSFG